MAILGSLVTGKPDLIPPKLSGLSLFQKLVRQVKLVLIVKHCIDDLKSYADARHSGKLLHRTHDDIAELPSGPSIHIQTGTARDGTPTNYQATVGFSYLNDRRAISTWAKLLEAPKTADGLRQLETVCDDYIAQSYKVLQKAKQNVSKLSTDIWIRWATKRGYSVHDERAQARLVKWEEAEQLLILQGKLHNLEYYLNTYIEFDYVHVRQRLGEEVSRLRAVFGSGWFFEWPSGQHPLNTTWPWADVKPSLMVLWGVCWMFFPTPYGEGDGHFRQDFQPRNGGLRHGNIISRQDIRQTAYQPHNGTEYTQPLLPESYVASLGQANMARQPEPMVPNPATFFSNIIGSEFPYNVDQGVTALENSTSHSALASAIRNSSPWSLDVYSNDWQRWDLSTLVPGPTTADATTSALHPHQFRQPNTRDVAQSTSWLSKPDWSGENSSQLRPPPSSVYNSRSIYNPSLPPIASHSSSSSLMPPSNSFSYPPLDNMNEIHESRPYLDQERAAYTQMAEYASHHDPQDQPRYPTPPPPLSENPYNQQQGGDATADGRMDLPQEPKSESDAASPGRSKAVPKPLRAVTKDSNGRFYCNWQGCTEDIKDFGRKCEWSKHMDKHDRPYKCPAEGCEKLPGFTYSGGLLRHEREVHNKHGGPRKQLNCPHPNCKRHTGKGFSRQENLNEHLRRVHTDTGLPINGEETEDEGSEAQPGSKRKRHRGDSADLREEMKRLRQENEELRRQAEAQNVQTQEMMRQILQLQQNQAMAAGMGHSRMAAPPAQMT